MTARARLVYFVSFCVCGGAILAQQPQHPQAIVVAPAPPKATIGKIDITPATDGLRITISVTAAITPAATLIANPDRLVLDFSGCEIRNDNQYIPVGHEPVKDLRVSLYSAHPPTTRVVIDLTGPADFHVKPWEDGIVIVEIPLAKPQAATAKSVHNAAIVQKEPPTAPQTSSPPENAANTGMPPPAATSSPAPTAQTSAYDLMTKAKSLTVADLQSLEERSASDDPEAQTMLALACHAGVLLKQDDVQAISLLHKAADQGYRAAEESLGIFAEGGIGMPQPAPAEALGWYEKAVQHGSMDAATSIALMYANGKGVAKDSAQAVTWFRRAADGGDASAQYNLALMYERGEGVPKDYREAVRWLSKAADQNLMPAMMDLAEFSMRPPDPALAKDVPKAVKYYEQAANLGNPGAQINLASIFSKGLEGKPDYEQAAKWYRKAAEQGDRDGQFGLGVSYALGRGVPVDYEQARRWFTSAAEQGQVQAQFNLAIMYDEGKGVPADRDLAAHYYEMAAEKGMVKAQYRYGMLLTRTMESHNDRVAAYKWLMLSQDSIKESSSALSDVRKSMTEPEIAEAEHEVDTWRLAHRNARH